MTTTYNPPDYFTRVEPERCEASYTVHYHHALGVGVMFAVMYRCGRPKGHSGPHGEEHEDLMWRGGLPH